MKSKNYTKYILWGFAAAVLSMLAVIVCFWKLGVYPFGEYSVLTNDCYIQYIDFFRYLKEVMNGSAHIGYSFSKSLGGSLVALFGYYLSSPFNLLLYFFDINELETFILIITILKVGLCGFTFSLFISHRLENLKPVFVVIVSLAYAFTQYNVGQLSNISWLDGVYMLPIILWGIWRYVSEKKKGMLYVSIGLSIVFNWYTGYMNCLFAVIYFLYEQIRWNYKYQQLMLKKIVKQFFCFCGIELLGVMLSCAFFIPVVFGQSSGRSILDEGIFSFATNGSLLNIYRGFMIGTPNMGMTVSDSTITLFCGVLLLISAGYYFFSKSIKNFDKICTSVLVAVMIFSEFFKPLENIWCGFKFPAAFKFRFAYIVIFVIIFIAAQSLEQFDKIDSKIFCKIAGINIIIFLIFDFICPFDSIVLWIQIGLLLFYGIAVFIGLSDGKYRRICFGLIMVVFYSEILANSYWVTSEVYRKPAGEYAAYAEEQEKLVASIRTYDETSFYRMEQNKNRDKREYDNSFFANESLAYGYSGIQQYSSSYDKKTSDFIASMGYCKGIFPTFYHEPILTSDSLLGVRYVMSSKAYYGLEHVSNMQEHNGKSVYFNPYALSLGFLVNENALEPIVSGDQFDIRTILEDNPFEFQNKVYSAILGEDVRLYEPVGAEYVYDETTEKAVYTINSVGNENMIYGYTRSTIDGIPMDINGEYSCYYRSAWANMGIYQIGIASEENQVIFNVKGLGEEVRRKSLQAQREIAEGIRDDENSEPWIDSVFYMLNMDTFERVISKLQEQSYQPQVFEDGYVKGTYNAKTDGWLMLTIPNDENWKVIVNGIEVQVKDGVNTFMTVPVKTGENQIELIYHVKGISLGIVVSSLSIIIFVALSVVERRKRKII
ncbi:MAG: YfhO family protein [Frisingicoccus sp.]|uniref:YfhO family protein n=1 Tax=Frisingicoccus sp. TaxID=1918627 RepID=UPI00399B37BE